MKNLSSALASLTGWQKEITSLFPLCFSLTSVAYYETKYLNAWHCVGILDYDMHSYHPMSKAFHSSCLARVSGVGRKVKFFASSNIRQSFQWKTFRAWIQRTPEMGPCMTRLAAVADHAPRCWVERFSIALSQLGWAAIRFSFLNVSSVRFAGHFRDIRGKPEEGCD